MSDDDKIKTSAQAAAVSDDARLGRRLFFFRAATILTGAMAISLGARRARGQETDSDTGEGADPPGKGRKGGAGKVTSNTDSDWGPNRDPVGSPRKRPEAEKKDNGGDDGPTDSDTGPDADKRGKGRGKK